MLIFMMMVVLNLKLEILVERRLVNDVESMRDLPPAKVDLLHDSHLLHQTHQVVLVMKLSN